MNSDLNAQFSEALASLAPDDMVDALNRTEHAVHKACGDHGPNAPFPLGAETGRPADRVLRMLNGRTVGEVVAAVARLRSGVADELARTGAPAEVVRELREGGPRGQGAQE